MGVSDSTFSNVLRLHMVNKERVTEDIHLYIPATLSSNSKLRSQLTGSDTDMLCGLCDGLFIVATTALKYALAAGADGATSRFRSLLNSSWNGLSATAAAHLVPMHGILLVDAAGPDEPQGLGNGQILEKLWHLFSKSVFPTRQIEYQEFGRS